MSGIKIPQISVVMTVYNGERFLPEAMDSILAQSFSDFELIVVNDTSTDSTQTILESYSDPRLTIIENDENLGPYGAANAGLAIAQGELIARHDADDVSKPERFALQVARMREQPELVLLGTSYEVINSEGQLLELALLPTDNDELQKQLEQMTIFLHGTTIMRRKALESVGYYRDYFRVSQDYDLFLRLSEKGEIANLPEILYQYRFHGESLSRNKRDLQLACRRFAWSLAQQRRLNGNEEMSVPNDVVSAYPPEPYWLFRDARAKAYLYYISDKRELSVAAVNQAQEINPNEDIQEWQVWALAKGHALADLRGNTLEGVEFINWLFDTLSLPQSRNYKDKTIGQFYGDQAFIANEVDLPIFPLVLQAVRYDRKWLLNRGLWSILIRSFFKR